MANALRFLPDLYTVIGANLQDEIQLKSRLLGNLTSMATYVSLREGQLVFQNGATFSQSDAQQMRDHLPPNPNRYLYEEVEGLIAGIASGRAPRLRGKIKVSLSFENGATFSRANVVDVLGKIPAENAYLIDKLRALLKGMEDQANAKPIQRIRRAGSGD